MKKLSFLLIFTISIVKAYGNLTDVVPNHSFEAWHFSGWSEEPQYWTTNNSNLLVPAITRDTDAYDGLNAMRLSYIGYQPRAWTNFHLTTHPLNLGGYIKSEMDIGDSLMVSVHIFQNQILVDSGNIVFFSGINAMYTSFVIPISQNSSNADSCEISITGGMTLETSVSFDDLQFDFAQGISLFENTDMKLFPNPCSDFILLGMGNTAFRPERIVAFNALGQSQEIKMSIDKSTAHGYIVRMNTSALKSGTWQFVISNKQEAHSIMVIKN